jgi:hypothetical protein
MPKVKVVPTPQQKVELESSKVLEILNQIPNPNVKFSQESHLRIYFKAYNAYINNEITFPQLARIGSKLLVTIPKGKNLGIYTNKDIFDLLETCNSLIFYIFSGDTPKHVIISAKKQVIELSEKLRVQSIKS